MRLDPKKVRFVTPFTALGLFGDAVRFVRGPKTVHLQETALVVEGNVLKVGLLGVELLFRRALAEWTSVTIPYSRITRAKYSRVPVARLVSLLMPLVWVAAVVVARLLAGFDAAVMTGMWGVIPLAVALYVFLRVSPRYVLDFRAKSGRRTRLLFHITDKKLRKAFAARLGEYRAAAARHAVPDPKPPRRARWQRAALWVGGLVLAAVLGVTAMYLVGEAVERFDPSALKVNTKGP